MFIQAKIVMALDSLGLARRLPAARKLACRSKPDKNLDSRYSLFFAITTTAVLSSNSCSKLFAWPREAAALVAACTAKPVGRVSWLAKLRQCVRTLVKSELGKKTSQLIFFSACKLEKSSAHAFHLRSSSSSLIHTQSHPPYCLPPASPPGWEGASPGWRRLKYWPISFRGSIHTLWRNFSLNLEISQYYSW